VFFEEGRRKERGKKKVGRKKKKKKKKKRGTSLPLFKGLETDYPGDLQDP
jgi:hypothetical protein